MGGSHGRPIKWEPLTGGWAVSGLSKFEHLWIPGWGRGVVGSLMIPEMSDTGSGLVPYPILSHTVKWSQLPCLQLRMHRCQPVLGHTQGHLWFPGPVDSSLGPPAFYGCFFNRVCSQVPHHHGGNRGREATWQGREMAETDVKPQPGALQLWISGCLQGWCSLLQQPCTQ